MLIKTRDHVDKKLRDDLKLTTRSPTQKAHNHVKLTVYWGVEWRDSR